MRLYSTTIIADIKKALKNGKCKITRILSYNDLYAGNAFYSANVRVEFKVYPDGKRDAIVITHDHTIDTEYINEWKECPSHKFLLKDWKKEQKDQMNNMIYYHIVYTTESGASYAGIIRKLYELGNDMEDETAQTYIKRYGDLRINGEYFTIIKLWPANNRFETTCELNIGSTHDYKKDTYNNDIDSLYSEEENFDIDPASNEKTDEVNIMTNELF